MSDPNIELIIFKKIRFKLFLNTELDKSSIKRQFVDYDEMRTKES